MTAPGQSLLDPSFLRELDALRRRLQIRARSGRGGEHAAKRRGGSAEFQEHRAYVPGDDLRRVDWLAFARTGEPVVKLFRTEEDVLVRLLVDASASMDFGAPARIEVARRLAAAFGYMALAGSQRAQVLVAQPPSKKSVLGTSGFSDTTQGAGLGCVGATRRGQGGLPSLLRDLADVRAGGSVDLSRAIDQVLRRAERPGLLVVLSDFFDPGPVTQALGRARLAGHDVSLVQILDPSELTPEGDGDVTFVDSETGQLVETTMDASAIETYLQRLTGLIEELRAWSRKHQASYVRVTTTDPLEAAVRRFVARSID